LYTSIMKEIDFDPATMKRATHSDITRIWRQLWGSPIIVLMLEDGEWLDRTQYNYNLRAAGTDQGGIHNPIVENPASGLPATNEVNDALEIQMVRHKEIRQERPAYRANLVVSADALPDEGQQEPAASATEPSEVN